jgi:hypothetical protein
MVVGLTTTCAIGAYHHKSCEFEALSGDVHLIQHYLIKFVSDLGQVESRFFGGGGFLPPIKLSS